jgi:ElaB/YqjD/DUF883 family membrane-anchored ribosome-binding protein
MGEHSERAIRERIEATRARMGDTIEEIGDRVNPDRLQRELKERARDQVDELKQTAKQKARETMKGVEHGVADTGRGLWDTIKENPIPAGMVGIGLAWLVANGKRDDHHHHRDRGYPASRGYASSRGYDTSRGYSTTRGYTTSGVPGDRGYGGHPEAGAVGFGSGYTAPGGGPRGGGLESTTPIHQSYQGADSQERNRGMGDRVEEAADRVRDEAGELAESVREKGSELTHRASEGFHDVRDRAEHWMDDAQDSVRRAEHRVEDAVREHPMAAGAVAVALGFAAGMMIPETRKEHEMMGPTRDRLLDRAQETVGRAQDKAQEVARETASAAAERAVDEIWSGGDDHGERAHPPMTEPGR